MEGSRSVLFHTDSQSFSTIVWPELLWLEISWSCMFGSLLGFLSWVICLFIHPHCLICCNFIIEFWNQPMYVFQLCSIFPKWFRTFLCEISQCCHHGFLFHFVKPIPFWLKLIFFKVQLSEKEQPLLIWMMSC